MNVNFSFGAPAGRSVFRLMRFSAGFFVLVIAATLFSATQKNFGTLNNATNILAQFGPLALLALGQMCVILVRGFDISVGAVMALSTVVAAQAILQFGIAGLLFAPIVGGAFGLLNGALIGIARIQPIIATLGTLLLARGVALFISNNGQVVVVTGDPQTQLLDFSFGQISGLPYSTLMTFAVFIFIGLMLKYSRFGRKLFLIGGDPEAARLVGVDTGRVTAFAYMICGICAGLAAVLILARTGTGLPTDGVGMELQAIAAAVIGGTQLAGGIAQPLGVLFSALFIQTVYTGLSFSAISPYAGETVMGIVILIAGMLDRVTHWFTKVNFDQNRTATSTEDVK